MQNIQGTQESKHLHPPFPDPLPKKPRHKNRSTVYENTRLFRLSCQPQPSFDPTTPRKTLMSPLKSADTIALTMPSPPPNLPPKPRSQSNTYCAAEFSEAVLPSRVEPSSAGESIDGRVVDTSDVVALSALGDPSLVVQRPAFSCCRGQSLSAVSDVLPSPAPVMVALACCSDNSNNEKQNKTKRHGD